MTWQKSLDITETTATAATRHWPNSSVQPPSSPLCPWGKDKSLHIVLVGLIMVPAEADHN